MELEFKGLVTHLMIYPKIKKMNLWLMGPKKYNDMQQASKASAIDATI